MQTFNLIDIIGSDVQDRKLFVERERVQAMAELAFKSHRHVLVYGRPGDGKTTLLRRNLAGEPTTILACQPRQTITDLYRALISEAGAPVTVEQRRKRKRRLAATVRVVSGSGEEENEVIERATTVDLGNIGDVLRILVNADFDKWVVINDFHLLARSAQKILARDLKTISENTKLRFVIVSSWTSPSRFRDLADESVGHVAPVHVSSWDHDDLLAIVMRSEELLNVELSDEVRSELVTNAWGCVRLLHEILFDFYQRNNVIETCRESILLKDLGSVRASVEEVLGRPFHRFELLASRFTAKRLRSVDNEALRKEIEALVPNIYIKKVRTAVVRDVLQGRTQKYEKANQIREMKAARRRALIELLWKDAISKAGSHTSLEDLKSMATERCELNGIVSNKKFRKTISDFSEMKERYHISEQLLEFDNVDGSIRIVNSRLLAFFRSLEPGELEALFTDETEVADPENINLPYWVSTSLSRVRSQLSNVPGIA